MLAHRTSPTNLGLYLLSVIAAHDFGWIGTHETVDRMGATLDTMKRMEQFRGHFYNWYGTRDLRPLDPKYVSSVDSGNLAGHLIALGNAWREMIAQPVVGPQLAVGIEDSIALVRESLARSATIPRAIPLRPSSWRKRSTLSAPLAAESADPAEMAVRWRNSGSTPTVTDIAPTLTTERGDGAAAEPPWAEAMRAPIEVISARPNC